MSKRGHFGLVFCSWKKSCTYFEVVMVVFWAFVIAIVFFVPEFLVKSVACVPYYCPYCFITLFESLRRGDWLCGGEDRVDLLT